MGLPESDVRLLGALSLAITRNKNQSLDWGSLSRIEHSIAVAELLAQLGLCDGDTLVAIALGSHLPGTAAKGPEIGRRFGMRVQHLVEELTSPSDVEQGSRLDWLLRRMPSASRQARAIQLASAIVTLRHLSPGWGSAQRLRYFEWVEKLRALLASTDDELDGKVREALRIARSQLVFEPRERPHTPTASGYKHTNPDPAWLQELHQVRAVVGRLEERIGDIIESADSGAPLVARGGSRPTSRKRTWKYADPRFRDAAIHGVGAIGFRVKNEETVFVSIDKAPEFELSKVLATVLAVISSERGAAQDGFLSFLPLDAVVSAMCARGHRSTRHALVVAIGRLRERLEAEHYPPLIVETRPGHGVRLRLRMPG